ncbi:hypothetical protein FBQ82_19960 [Anaerolineae bacterium CFX7]|nr:hypothetical protein [Anaerolineae bacterium CFX7]
MKWKKKGLIYVPDGSSNWARHTAMTPTPLLVNEQVIRIYAGFRDNQGVSRIGFVDVEAQNPSKVLCLSATPALDIGAPGTFDDNGVILGDVLEHVGQLWLYYVGFQIVQKVKFYAFSGLASSSDKGITFQRVSQVPILDRVDGERYLRSIHSVRIENDVWRVWYAAGDGWEWINQKPYPQYHIRYAESHDGKTFHAPSKLCIPVQGKEYRIGRPRVYKFADKYEMFYTRGTTDGDYLAGYAESEDGVHWVRRDEQLGIGLSPAGWDSRSVCYPALLRYRDTLYMFYNGNDMGRTGFGYAVLEA